MQPVRAADQVGDGIAAVGGDRHGLHHVGTGVQQSDIERAIAIRSEASHRTIGQPVGVVIDIAAQVIPADQEIVQGRVIGQVQPDLREIGHPAGQVRGGHKGHIIIGDPGNICGVVAKRHNFLNDVAARRQVSKRVIAIGVRDRAGRHRFAGIHQPVAVQVLDQIDRHIRQAGFADIIGAIPIQVIRHRAAYAVIDRRQVIVKIDIGIGDGC